LVIFGVWQEHGGFAQDDQNVALLAAGPAFSAGAVDTAAVQTVQVRCPDTPKPYHTPLLL